MIARNAKCPCGSGKQYKRCCVDKPNTVGQNTPKGNAKNGKKKFYPDSLICNNYSSEESLKLLSLLQLQPQNHGKNIRIENLITKVVNTIKEESKELNILNWKKDLLNECPRDYHEDPPESFFTENIIFSTGNNIVYPGIFTDIVEIFQNLITCTIENKKLPLKFVKESHDPILLILHIQNQIAKSLGHSYRIFEEIQTEELYIPSDEFLLTNKELFSFEYKDLKGVCDDLNIPYNTIDLFVFKWQQNNIDIEEFDDNPLFDQPFVFINGKFVLVMPTALLHCLVNHIITAAKNNNCVLELVKGFAKTQKHEIFPVLGRMGWRSVQMQIPVLKNQPDYMLLDESIWQVDQGRYVYVTILTENILDASGKAKHEKPFSRFFENRIDQITSQLKKEKDVTEIMLLAVICKIGLVSNTFLGLNKLKNVNYFLNLTPVDLNAITNNWKLNKLSLWKFAKYLEIAQKTIRFAPLTSPLAMYEYFKQNNESFFHSDSAPSNFILLDFSIAGDIRTKGLSKLDKIGIAYGNGNSKGYLQCIRKEEYYPVYISQEVYFGVIRSCLLKYECPIWLEAKNPGDTRPDIYANAILYWLNEIYDDAKDYISQLGKEPIRLELSLDTPYYNLEKLESLEIYDNTKSTIAYKIDLDKRQIFFTVPIEMIQFFAASDNKGERILIDFVLDMIGKLISDLGGEPISHDKKNEILNKYIPIGPKKMLIMALGDHDIKIADIDIPQKRYIQDCDVSYILENQLSWLNLPQPLSPKLNSSKEKIELLNNLVAVHYKMVVEKIGDYNAETFLLFLCKRHESLIQARAFRHLNYPAKLACYGQYYDVQNEFSESEKDLVETSLALRILIEFVALHMPKGVAIPSDNEVDIMLAHVIELINYASLSDSIKYEIEDPEIGKLPSGRIGISNEIERKGLHEFRNEMYQEEMHNYKENFHKFFKSKKRERNRNLTQQEYTDKLNDAFIDEWGITLGEFDMVTHALCLQLFSKGKSVDIMTTEDFSSLLMSITDFKEVQVKAFLDKMKFLQRPEPLKPPVGYEAWEVYPWRFNRRLSYLLRPIINFTKDNKEHLLLSARHLFAASENMIALFFNGALKVHRGEKKIIQLLAERNNIKGGEYRDEVYEWLKMNTALEVYSNEIKIKSNGFFISKQDKGDIDIMAIDKTNNIVYSLECKNTIQAKLTYDFKMEIDNYLGVNGKEGLIEKHVRRHRWLEENLEQVKNKLSLPVNPKIKSLVISNNILPLKYLKSVPIPIVSFYELKSGKYTI